MMNFLFALILCSVSAFAGKDSVVFPRVYNYGSSVQIQVWNHTDRTVTCSGSVTGRTLKGDTSSNYYFDTVRPRITSFRSFYPRDFSDRFVSVNHSVFCH